MNAREWIDAFAQKLGTTGPTTDEFKQLLDLAGEAAHSSERVAAPIACFLVGRCGIDPAAARRLAAGS